MSKLKDFEIKLEALTNKNQANKLAEDYFKDFLKSRLSKEVLGELDEPKNKEYFNCTVLALARIALNKRMYHSSLIGIIGLRLKDYQKASGYLESLVRLKLIDYDYNRSQFIVRYELPQEIWDKLSLFQNPLPMIVEPEKLVNNYDTGYISTPKKSLIKRHPTKKDIYLENLNRMNSVPLSINKTVYENTENSWNIKDKMTLRNFKKFCRDQKHIVEYYINNFDRFYLTWLYDHRGRFYDTGYLLKIQGNQYQKGLLELADKELITE